MTDKVGNQLTVERGFQGVARAWANGTVIARNFTEYDHRAFKENIEKLNTNQQETNSQLEQLMNDWDFGLITSSPTSFDDFGSIA